AIIGEHDGTSFVDVTNPAMAHEVAFIAGNVSIWREMRTYSHYAYIVTEGKPPPEGGPEGVQIVDLADPSHPRLVGDYSDTFTAAHSIGIYDGYAYINGSRLNSQISGMRVLTLANPAQPLDVGEYRDRYVHDGYVRGNTGYLCCIGQGLVIADMTD